ncbi:MAG: hypothetical protein ACLQVN_22345 [Bryobacteraceae bacterium]
MGNATAGGSDGEDRILHLRRSAEALGGIQEQARGDYTCIVALTAGLTGQVRGTIEEFGTQHECLEVLAGAAETLRGLSAGAPATGSHGAGRMAPTLPSRYTMDE